MRTSEGLDWSVILSSETLFVIGLFSSYNFDWYPIG